MSNFNYTAKIRFEADASSLKSLKMSIGSLSRINTGDIVNTKNLDQAQQSVQRITKEANLVRQALQASFNPTLNTHNIDTFKKKIAEQGLSINGLATSWQEAGAKGTAAFRNMSSALTSLNLPIREQSNLIKKMGETFGNTIRWTLSASAINMVTQSVRKAYTYVKELDTSLNDIRIVTGKSADEMERFARQANKAAKELGKSTTDYTKASLIFYQQGLSDQEVQARATTTLKASNVTGQSTDAVSEQLTAVWNGYKVSAQETELYIDKLAAVAATTASDLEELSTGMSKVASAANNMGVGIDQLNGMLSTAISVTRQAPETIGNAFKTIFARISAIEAGEDTETTFGNYTAKMNELGFSVLDSNNKLRNMGEVIEEIGNKWNTLSHEQQNALAQTMAGTRQYNNLLALFDNWDMYKRAMETSATAAGTLQKQQETYMDSIEAHLEQLGTSAERLFAAILKPESINPVIDTITGAIDQIASLIESIGGGGNLLLAVLTSMAHIFAGPLASGIYKFYANIVNSISATQSLRTMLETIASIDLETAGIDEYNTKMLSFRETLIKLYQSGTLTSETFKELNGDLDALTSKANEYGRAMERASYEGDLGLQKSLSKMGVTGQDETAKKLSEIAVDTSYTNKKDRETAMKEAGLDELKVSIQEQGALWEKAYNSLDAYKQKLNEFTESGQAGLQAQANAWKQVSQNAETYINEIQSGKADVKLDLGALPSGATNEEIARVRELTQELNNLKITEEQVNQAKQKAEQARESFNRETSHGVLFDDSYFKQKNEVEALEAAYESASAQLEQFNAKQKELQNYLATKAGAAQDNAKFTGNLDFDLPASLSEDEIARVEKLKTEINNLASEYGQVESATKKVDAAWEELNSIITKGHGEFQTNANVMNATLEKMSDGTLPKLKSEMQSLEASLQQAMQPALIEAQIQQMIKFASSAMMAVSAITMLSNLQNIWENDTLTFGQKVLQTVQNVASAATMLLPVILSLISVYRKHKAQKLAAATAEAAVEAQLAKMNATQVLTEEALANKKKEVLSLTLQQMVAEKKITAEQAKQILLNQSQQKLGRMDSFKQGAKQAWNAAKGGQGAGKGVLSLLNPTKAGGIAKTGKAAAVAGQTATGIGTTAAAAGAGGAASGGAAALGAAMVAAGPYILIAAAIATAMALAYKNIKDNTNKAEKAHAAAKKELEATTEAAANAENKYKELQQSISNLKQGEETLKGLVEGTAEWKKALGDVNNEVLDLLAKYPELSQYVTTVDGQMKISAEGLEKIQEAQLAELQDAQRRKVSSQIRESETRAVLEAKQFAEIEKYGSASAAAFNEGLQTALGVVSLGFGAGYAIEQDEELEARGKEILESETLNDIREAMMAQSLSSEAIFASEETLATALNKTADQLSPLERSLINNKDATIKLVDTLNAQDATEVQQLINIGKSYGAEDDLAAVQIGRKHMAEEKARENSIDKDDIRKKYKYKDKELAEQYAEAMGWKIDDVKTPGGGKDVTIYKSDGTDETISLDDMAVRVAKYQRDQQAEKATQSYADRVISSTSNLNLSQNVLSALAHLGKDSFKQQVNALQKTELKELKDAFNLIDFTGLAESIEGATSNTLQNQFNTITKQAENNWSSFLEGWQTKTQEAFNNVTAESSTTEAQALANIVNELKKYGKEEEFAELLGEVKPEKRKEFVATLTSTSWGALGEDSYKAQIGDLAALGGVSEDALNQYVKLSIGKILSPEELSEMYKGSAELLEKIKKDGKISKEEYRNLSAESKKYFRLMADGTAQLIGSAIQLEKIEEPTAHRSLLEQGTNLEKAANDAASNYDNAELEYHNISGPFATVTSASTALNLAKKADDDNNNQVSNEQRAKFGQKIKSNANGKIRVVKEFNNRWKPYWSTKQNYEDKGTRREVRGNINPKNPTNVRIEGTSGTSYLYYISFDLEDAVSDIFGKMYDGEEKTSAIKGYADNLEYATPPDQKVKDFIISMISEYIQQFHSNEADAIPEYVKADQEYETAKTNWESARTEKKTASEELKKYWEDKADPQSANRDLFLGGFSSYKALMEYVNTQFPDHDLLGLTKEKAKQLKNEVLDNAESYYNENRLKTKQSLIKNDVFSKIAGLENDEALTDLILKLEGLQSTAERVSKTIEELDDAIDNAGRDEKAALLQEKHQALRLKRESLYERVGTGTRLNEYHFDYILDTLLPEGFVPEEDRLKFIHKYADTDGTYDDFFIRGFKDGYTAESVFQDIVRELLNKGYNIGENELNHLQVFLQGITNVREPLDKNTTDIQSNALAIIENRLENTNFAREFQTEVNDLARTLGFKIEVNTDLKASQSAIEDYRNEINNLIEGAGEYGDLNAAQKEAKAEELVKQYMESISNALEKIKELREQINEETEEALSNYEAELSILEQMQEYYDIIYAGNSKERAAKQTEFLKTTQYNQWAQFEIQTARLEASRKSLENLRTAGNTASEEYKEVSDAFVSAIQERNSALLAAINSSLAVIEDVASRIFESAAEISKASLDSAKTLQDIISVRDSRWVNTDVKNSEYTFKELDFYATKLINDAQGDFALQSKLQEVYEKQLKALKTKTALTKADFEIAKKTLEVEQARYALEMARNNKSSIQLVRNANGRYGYAYAADPTEIQKAEETLAKANNELYNSLKDAVADSGKELADGYSIIQDFFKEAMLNDGVIDEEEKKRLEAMLVGYNQEVTNGEAALAALAEYLGVSEEKLISNAEKYGFSSDFLNILKDAETITADNLLSQLNSDASFQEALKKIYKTDENGALEYDEDGKLIPLYEGLEQIPNYLKTSVTDFKTTITEITTALSSTITWLSAFGKGLKDVINTLQAEGLLTLKINPPKDSNVINPGGIPSEALNDKGAASGALLKAWGPEGKFLKVHEKELVLNKTDTQNILDAVDMVRAIQMGRLEGLATVITVPSIEGAEMGIQNMVVHASFPNAVDHNEIRMAFADLPNLARQYISKNRIGN